MGWTAVRLVFHAVATVLLMAAIGTIIYALATPAWQTVDISEYSKVHEHGLWIDCWTTYGKPVLGDSVTCSYKFNQPDKVEEAPGHGATHPHHLNLKWHKIVLGLMVSAALCGLIGLLGSFVTFCIKVCSIIWAVCCFIATGLSATGLVIFFRNAYDKEYRYVHGREHVYDQDLGVSFWCAVGASLAFLVSAIFSVLTAVLYLVSSRRNTQMSKTWPKHHTAV